MKISTILRLIAILSIQLCVIIARPQYYFNRDLSYAGNFSMEAGISFGAMNCFTDLGGKKGNGKGFIKDLDWRETKPAVGIYTVATFKEALGFNLEVNFGSIRASDNRLQAKDPDINGRYGRNLSFKSSIFDVHLGIEFHPLFMRTYDEDQSPYWSPYLIGGIGYFKFNPKAALNGRWQELHPLHTEGQGFSQYPTHKNYKLIQLNLPVGAGIRFEAGSHLYFRIELVHRMLFTDYLDDVSSNYIDPEFFSSNLSPELSALALQLNNRTRELSPGFQAQAGRQRGDPADKDSFFTFSLKLGYLLGKK